MAFWPLSSCSSCHGDQQLSCPGRASWGEPLPSGFNCFICFLGGCLLVVFGVWGLFWRRGGHPELVPRQFRSEVMAELQLLFPDTFSVSPLAAAALRCSHQCCTHTGSVQPSISGAFSQIVCYDYHFLESCLLSFSRIWEELASSPCICTSSTRSIFFSCGFCSK